MDLFSSKAIKNLLGNYRIFPSKGLGQNFLIDKSVLLKIIKTADLKPGDFVLEIGPGLGTLTREIAKKAKKVVSVEKDSKMVEILEETLQSYKNVDVITGDILRIESSKLFKNCKLKIENYKVVANLPYYIASPVIRKFLEAEKPPELMILMLQKEVAQRICAQPPDMTHSASSGSSRAGRGMNLLAISVQFYAEPKIISFVPKQSFWPQPKVDGAIIKIIPHKRQITAGKDLFFKIVKAGFSQPRKQILNNLSRAPALSSPNGLKTDKERVKSWLLKNNIRPNQRAETLSLENWISLAKTFSSLLR